MNLEYKIDAYFSKRKLDLEHHINLLDLEKFHRHLCDGLVVGFLGLNEGLKVLYSDEEIDFKCKAVLRNDFVKIDALNKNKTECKTN